MSGLDYSCNLFHFRNPIMSPWIEYLDSRKNQQSLSGHCWRIQIGLFRFEKDIPQCYFVTVFWMLPLQATNRAALQAVLQRIWNTIWDRLWYPVIVSLGTFCMSFISVCVCPSNNCLSSGDKLFKSKKVLVWNSFPVKGYKQKIRQFIKESGCYMA